jgi:hypothetical protein
MMNRLCVLLFLFICIRGTVKAQMVLTGDASVAFQKPNTDSSQYNVNFGRSTFLWRLDLFADAEIADNITFLSNFRMLQDQIPHVDRFAFRFSDIASSDITVEIGEIDIPFGNLGESRFPGHNPFMTLPLMNEHYTSMCKSDYNLWTFSPAYSMNGDGVRLLDQGLYDIGMKIYGSIGIFDYSFGVINGMLSATSTYAPNGLNPNHGFGKVGRVAVNPFQGLTIGVSYGIGPFMKDLSEDSLSNFYEKSPDSYMQNIAGGDIDLSVDHFLFHGEVITNTWQYVQNVNLKAFSYTGTAGYTFSPRISAAVRAAGIFFNSIKIHEYIPNNDDGYTGPIGYIPYSGRWDRDVSRIEGSIVYRLEKDILIKAMYQINRTYDLPVDPVDNVAAVQSVFSF